jgi:predicted aldo/keto reductase-like oxidoreductase
MKILQDGKLHRREFLAATAATALTAMAPNVTAAPAPAEEWRNRQPGMTYRRLGRTGFMVSSIGMGGDDVRPDNNDQVLWAVDQGLNYFDTAPQYANGMSEKGFGAVHKARGRDKIFQGTKVNIFPNRTMQYQQVFRALPEAEQEQIRKKATEEIEAKKIEDPDYLGPYFSGQAQGLRSAAIANILSQKYPEKVDPEKQYKQYIIDSVEKSLKAFDTDHVDCLLMRGIETPYELSNTPQVFEVFETLKKQGKARFLGFSAHTDPAGILEAAIATNVYSMCLIAYHFLNANRVDPIMAKAKKADYGVLAMKASRVLQNPYNRRELIPERVKKLNALVPGDKMTPFQKGFHWALQNKNLSGVVIGMTTLDHAKEDVPLAMTKA